MSDADWTGPRQGTLLGHYLVRCATHGGWWTKAIPCPACVLVSRITSLEAQRAESEDIIAQLTELLRQCKDALAFLPHYWREEEQRSVAPDNKVLCRKEYCKAHELLANIWVLETK